MKKYLLPIIHLLIFLIAISSPFWIDWRVVLIGFVLYVLQMILLKGCVLSFWEFGRVGKKPKKRFITHYLSKIFPNLNIEKVGFYLDYVLAPLVPLLAFFWQAVLKHLPLIRI